MDRAYCLSLQRDVEINEAIELHRKGVISGNDDFACLDPNCRASYICINIGKSTYKNSPHFRTAENSGRKHVSGCTYEIEYKNPVIIGTGKPRKPRSLINDDTEIIFENYRPSNYFVISARLPGGQVDEDSNPVYVNNYGVESDSGPANPRCYSIERLLNGGWRSRRRVVIDGHSSTIKSIVMPVDNYMPDKYRRYIYCGLAKAVPSDDDSCMFKFGRSFGVDSRMVDVYLKVEQSAINTLIEAKSPYYRELAGRILSAAKTINRHPGNPSFIYALGVPKLDLESKSCTISVDNLDHFYIESQCNRPLLIASMYSNWEENQHYFDN